MITMAQPRRETSDYRKCPHCEALGKEGIGVSNGRKGDKRYYVCRRTPDGDPGCGLGWHVLVVEFFSDRQFRQIIADVRSSFPGLAAARRRTR